MFVSRRTGQIRWNTIRNLCIAALAAITASVVSGATARADDLPFWEQADAAAKAAKANSSKSTYKKASYKKSKKSYASKSSGKKLGGYAEATEPKKKKKGVKVAALDGGSYGSEPKKSLSGGSVRWVASSGCVDSSLKSVIYSVASNFGPVTVSSTCRSRGHNARVGGAKRSKHLTGDAIDFRVHGNNRGVYAFLRSHGTVGGLKHYGGGLYHIDNGDRRTW
jgi:Peptidase M15